MRERMARDPKFKESHLKRIRRNTQKNAEEIKALVNEFRKDGCKTCPEKTSECLDAHHINPSHKKFEVGRMMNGRNVSSKLFKEELKKCICLCKNCHAKLHAGLRTLPPIQPPLSTKLNQTNFNGRIVQR